MFKVILGAPKGACHKKWRAGEENIYKICGEDLLQRKQAMTKLLSEVEEMMMVND